MPETVLSALTVGIDLASQPKNTGLCAIRWDGGRGSIVDLSSSKGVDDGTLLKLLKTTDIRLGFDVPLGWPAAFVNSLAPYANRQAWTTSPAECRLRATDRALKATLQRRRCQALDPLSVAADRIAMPAMRAAKLLSEAGFAAMPRDGTGRVVEVYPAAALSGWGLACKGYKGKKGREVCLSLVDDLVRKVRDAVVVTDDHHGRLAASDHCFDAFVAAIVVRCHEVGLTEQVPQEHRIVAQAEGWILLPVEGSLEKLASPG